MIAAIKVVNKIFNLLLREPVWVWHICRSQASCCALSSG